MLTKKSIVFLRHISGWTARGLYTQVYSRRMQNQTCKDLQLSFVNVDFNCTQILLQGKSGEIQISVDSLPTRDILCVFTLTATYERGTRLLTVICTELIAN